MKHKTPKDEGRPQGSGAGQRAVLALEGNITWEGNLEDMRQARYTAEQDEDYRADTG